MVDNVLEGVLEGKDVLEGDGVCQMAIRRYIGGV